MHSRCMWSGLKLTSSRLAFGMFVKAQPPQARQANSRTGSCLIMDCANQSYVYQLTPGQGSRLRRPPMEQDVKLTPLDVKIFDSQVPWDVEIQMSKDALFESRWCRIIITLVLFDTHKKYWPLCHIFSNKCADLWVISQHSVLFLCQYSLFHDPNGLRASSTEILLGVIRGKCGTVHCANIH